MAQDGISRLQSGSPTTKVTQISQKISKVFQNPSLSARASFGYIKGIHFSQPEINSLANVIVIG